MKKGLLTEEESQLVIGAIPLQAIPREVSKYLAKIGAKGGKIGGKASTKRKGDAARANGHKGGRPARRFCDERAGGCGCELTSTDISAGYCTNCHHKL